ncbi:MAG: cupin domain-containing protein [Aquabacterium sp.]
MKVIAPAAPLPTVLPGIQHVTRASAGDGLSTLSVWHQTLEAGAATPPHRHDCDEVVMCMSGSGEVRSGQDTLHFHAGCTLALPADGEHQIVNSGGTPMEIIGVFAATPVVTRDLRGAELALPWQS